MKQTIPLALFVMLLATSSLIGQSDDPNRFQNNQDFNEPFPRKNLINDLSTFDLRNIKPNLKQKRVEIPLPLKKEQLEKYQISSATSNTHSKDFEPLKTRYKNGNLQLKPGETTVLRSNDIQKTKLTTKKTYFPGRIIKVGKTEDNQENTFMDSWRLSAKAVKLPLTWQNDKSAYATRILVELEAAEDNQTSFDGEVDVDFFSRGSSGAKFLPVDFSSRGSSGEEFLPSVTLKKDKMKQYVWLTTKTPSKPTIEVESDFGNIKTNFDIKPVELKVSPVDKSIPGYGLGSTKINIHCSAGDGTALEESFFIEIIKDGDGKLSNTMPNKPSDSPLVTTTLTSKGAEGVDLTAQGFSVKSETIHVDYQPIQLEFTKPEESTIPGFGIGTEEIEVAVKTKDGQPLKDASLDVELSIEEGSGTLSDTTLSKKSGTSAVSTQLRSAGIKDTKLVAHAPDVSAQSKDVTIKYSWPIVLLVVTLIGGCIGAGVRLFRQKREEKPARNAISSVLVGAISGFLLVMATVLGLGQLNFSTHLATTEAGAVVLALLGGYTGDGVFEWLSQKIGLTDEKNNE